LANIDTLKDNTETIKDNKPDDKNIIKDESLTDNDNHTFLKSDIKASKGMNEFMKKILRFNFIQVIQKKLFRKLYFEVH
jgi:hypothetical protein